MSALEPLLRSGWEAFLGIIYPNICQFCKKQRATAAEGYVCAGCQAGVRFVRPPLCERCGLPFQGSLTAAFVCSNCHDMRLHFSRARSAVVSIGVAREAIHRFKYNHALWAEPFLAGLLVREAAPVLRDEGWDLLAPVPLHHSRQRFREFNQAERLASALSLATGIGLEANLLIRVQETRTQTRLSRDERARNVRNAFALARPADLSGRRVVLVDDVLTTGATTNDCARVLRKAGAAEVCVWTLARGV